MEENQENQVQSIEELDALLNSEFGTPSVTTNTETNETNDNAGTTSKETDSVEDTQKETKESVVENTDTTDQNVVDDKTQTTKVTKEEKEGNAFAALRKQASEEKARADQESEFVKELAASYGYTDVSKFKEDVKKAKMEQDAQAKGIDPEVYRTMQEQREKIEALEEKDRQKEYITKAEEFKNSIENAESKYNVTRDEIYTRLENAGYDVQTILALPNVDIVIRGILSDKIQEFSKQEQIDKLKSLENFSDEKHDSSAKETKLSVDDIISQEMKQYKADNYL